MIATLLMCRHHTAFAGICVTTPQDQNWAAKECASYFRTVLIYRLGSQPRQGISAAATTPNLAEYPYGDAHGAAS